MYLGNKIRLLLAKDHWTPLQLANHIGVPKETVDAWISGSLTPSDEEMFKIARFFRISVEELKGQTVTVTPPKPVKYKKKIRIKDILSGLFFRIVRLILIIAIIGVLIYLIVTLITNPDKLKVTTKHTLTCTVDKTTYKLEATTIFNTNYVIKVEGDTYLLDKVDFNEHTDVDGAFNIIKKDVESSHGSCK